MTDISRAIAIGKGCGPADLRWLAAAAGGRERILELGSFLGRSARAMLDNSDATLWCVDTWRGSGRGGKSAGLAVDEGDFRTFLANTADVSDRVVILKMTTRKAAEQLPAAHFDLVFIDADHSYQAVMFDIAMSVPLLRSGGILCGHDHQAGWKGVDRAVAGVVLDPQHAGKAIWWAEDPWLKSEQKSKG